MSLGLRPPNLAEAGAAGAWPKADPGAAGAEPNALLEPNGVAGAGAPLPNAELPYVLPNGLGDASQAD